jgi:hypothetical protein
VPRSATLETNPKVNDPMPPNSYHWVFTERYHKFPKLGISRWTAGECRDCEEALEKHYLWVEATANTGFARPYQERGKRGKRGYQPKSEFVRDTEQLLYVTICESLENCSPWPHLTVVDRQPPYWMNP